MVSEKDIAEMVDSFGEAGEKALIRAIQAYGKARGERLKERHQEQGLLVNLRSLFEHYDLPGHPDTRKERTHFTDDKLVSDTHLCPYERLWRAHACNDVGLLYCQHFHHAFWQTYRPDIDVQIPETLTKDDPYCRFIVTQPPDD